MNIKMIVLKLFLSILFIGSISSIYSQSILTPDIITLKESLSKERVEVFDPGDSGLNCIWDFKHVKFANSKVSFTYETDSLGTFVLFDNKQVRKYKVQNDTLYELRNETPLYKTVYNKPIVLLKYPIVFSDSVVSSFEGYGLYCKEYYYEESGTTRVLVDGKGAILLSETDTLKNVFRMHTLKVYSIGMNLDPNAIDTTSLNQIIEERYEWYAYGYKYPVFELITSTSYFNLIPIGRTQVAYCFLPDKQDLLSTSINEQGQYSVEKNSGKDIIHYAVELDKKNLSVKYKLDKDARILMLISNVMGVVYRHVSHKQNKGTDYTISLSLDGLPKGVYVLYINVNGKVYSEKVLI